MYHITTTLTHSYEQETGVNTLLLCQQHSCRIRTAICFGTVDSSGCPRTGVEQGVAVKTALVQRGRTLSSCSATVRQGM
jgi:hypothetical protein